MPWYMEMNETERLWFDLLMGMDSACYHLQQIRDTHANCSGCNLCYDAEAMCFTLDLFYDRIEANAPSKALLAFDEEIASALKDEPLYADPKAEPVEPAADPVVVDVPELPAAKNKPYWLE